MRHIGVSAAMSTALIIGLFPGLIYPGSPKAEDQAKEVVGKFIKAFKAKELDKLLEVVDVPWVDDLAKGEVIKTKEALKKHLQALLQESKPENLGEVLRVVAFSKLRDKIKQEEIRKMLDQVISKEDLVVEYGVGKRERSIALVRVRDGKAKIVGGAGGGLPD